jgi:hypothetical protein
VARMGAATDKRKEGRASSPQHRAPRAQNNDEKTLVREIDLGQRSGEGRRRRRLGRRGRRCFVCGGTPGHRGLRGRRRWRGGGSRSATDACAREERCGACTIAEGEGKGETGLDHKFIKRGTSAEVAIDGHGAGGFDLESREGEVAPAI